MTNLEKLIMIIGKLLGYKTYAEIYERVSRLIQTATVCGFIYTKDLEKIEIALCKKLNLDYIEVSRKYYNLDNTVCVDSIIFKEYECGRGYEYYIPDYNTDTIEFRKEDYREVSEIYDDNEYIFDTDDIEF